MELYLKKEGMGEMARRILKCFVNQRRLVYDNQNPVKWLLTRALVICSFLEVFNWCLFFSLKMVDYN